MKWQTLPGPAKFLDDLIDHLRSGVSVVVGAATNVHTDLEAVLYDLLKHDRWSIQHVTIESHQDPLTWLTEKLYLEPEQWVGWSVEKLFGRLPSGQVIVIDGVTGTDWEVWRQFLREFEVASRSFASDIRPLLLMVVRGVPIERLQVEGAALTLKVWHGVFGELDILMFVDQCLRAKNGSVTRHHKLIVRQISALALWDLELAHFLADQPERDLFDPQSALQAGRESLLQGRSPIREDWQQGGIDQLDGVDLPHAFVLLDQGDPKMELRRRLWAAQVAELLPLIEIRRRELAIGLERYVKYPFWIDSSRKVESLHDLEIGSLAHVARTNKVEAGLRDRAERLARYRNILAHLGLLVSTEALDQVLHAPTAR